MWKLSIYIKLRSLSVIDGLGNNERGLPAICPLVIGRIPNVVSSSMCSRLCGGKNGFIEDFQHQHAIWWQWEELMWEAAGKCTECSVRKMFYRGFPRTICSMVAMGRTSRLIWSRVCWGKCFIEDFHYQPALWWQWEELMWATDQCVHILWGKDFIEDFHHQAALWWLAVWRTNVGIKRLVWSRLCMGKRFYKGFRLLISPSDGSGKKWSNYQLKARPVPWEKVLKLSSPSGDSLKN